MKYFSPLNKTDLYTITILIAMHAPDRDRHTYFRRHSMNYSKKGTTRKQKALVSKSTKLQETAKVSVFKMFLVLIVAVVAVGIGAGFGMMNGILENAPDIDDINVVPEGFQTSIYNQDGELITTLSTINSNREYVYYKDIPEDLVNAFIAIEDERFRSHNGIDIYSIGRAFYQGVKEKNFHQGGSTITQQLIKNEVFNVGLDEDTFMESLERKIQEQYLAIELEKRLSKDEILEYYLNSIYLGEGCHGVQTAAKTYFGKELDELTVSECTVIAAITQNPSKYDPIVYPENNVKRRQSALDKMLELGFITESEYNTACADSVYTRVKLHHNITEENKTYNSYFIDATINALTDQLINEYGYTAKEASNAVYAGGLSIYITQDDAIQEICDTVLNDDANYPNTTQVSLSYQLSLLDEEGNSTNYSTNHLLKYYKELTGNPDYSLIYASEDAARAAADQFRDAMIEESGNPDIKYLEAFDTTIQPQISFSIMDQHTGQIKAIVGGRGPKIGNLTLDRATDSTRQPGSCFKVLAAFVPALDASGMTLATTYEDSPFNYANGRPVQNWWGSSYRGFNSIRDAIRDSMNVIAVKTITDVGPEVSFEYLTNMGITTLVESETYADGTVYSDIQQSLALGGITNGVTNVEINAAYASIANLGVYTEPIFYTKVLNHDGSVLIDNTPETRQVMKPTTAWLLNNAMKDVITSGTGGPCALASGMPVSGKTGTSSKDYDLWFCGSTPYYTASIWLGYDINTSLPSGSGSLHERMWSKIMNQIVELEEQEIIDFPQCEGITSATVCRISGLLAGEGCTTRTEYFAVGTVPTVSCSGHTTVEMCAESNLPATNGCPEHYTMTYFHRADGTVYIPSEIKKEHDIPEDFEGQTCPIHPELPPEEVPDEDGNFTISSSIDGVGGTITESSKVPQGGSKTFYMTPSPGYIVKDVYVDGVSQGPISSFTFNDVGKNHSIIVQFMISNVSTDATTATTTETITEAATEATTATEAP